MAAISINYIPDRDIFLKGIKFKSPVGHFLSDLEEQLAIITSVSASTSETTQFFLTFDDIINYIHFGRGLGSIRISGIAFLTCDGDMPGLRSFFKKIGSKRGKVVSVSLGQAGGFSGPVVGSSVEVVGEPETVASFSVDIVMTSHTLGSSARAGSSCSGGGLGSAGEGASGENNNSTSNQENTQRNSESSGISSLQTLVQTNPLLSAPVGSFFLPPRGV
jgi:hypothetical protein